MRVQKKRSGNPNWGKPNVLRIHYPATITEFERLLLKLNLEAQEDVVASPEVRRWVHANANKRWVPEWLLDRLGVMVHVTGDLT